MTVRGRTASHVLQAPAVFWLCLTCLGGSSLAQTETVSFDFDGFTEISVSTVFNVTVTQGPDFVVEVTIDEDEVDSLDVTQTGTRLDLALKLGDHDIETLEGRVTLPVLNRIDLGGVIRATLRGFNQSQLAVDVDGTSQLRGDSLTISDLTANVSGVSVLDFGDISPLETANISVSGVSTATLNMNIDSSLLGSVSGVSRLFYYGTNVAVSVEIAFGSSLIRLGDTLPGGFNERLYFAQFAGGQGLFSQIVLYSLEAQDETTARIVLRDGDGEPIIVELNDQEVIGELEVTIPPNGLRSLKTKSEGELVEGSATVLSDRPLSGVIIFGGTFGLAGVGATEAMTSFSTPVETSDADGINTGFAVMNLEEDPIVLTLRLYDSEGEFLGENERPMVGLGHFADFLTDFAWPPAISFEVFQGTLEVTASGRISATALQLRPNQFATMPVSKKSE